MVKKLTKVLCLILAITMAVTLVSCKESKKPEKKPIGTESTASDVPGTEQEGSNIDDSAAMDEILDGQLGGLTDGETIYDPEIIPEPEFFPDDPNGDYQGGEEGEYWDGYVVLPETYYETQSPEYEDGLEGEEFEDLDDLEDESGVDRTNAVSLIQKEGEKVEGKNREFNIDISNVAYPNYRGIGLNSFPTTYCDEVKDIYPFLDVSEVNYQLQSKRIKSAKPHWNRMWFDIHWFTTREESNYAREDIENNKDYQNYKNGIYDFESSYMESVEMHLDMWKASGTKVALNYAWKVGVEIQEWYGFPNLAKPETSAPYDLDLYAESCADLLEYFWDVKKYDHIEALTFYNEPHYAGDYSAYVDEKVYWVAMLNRVSDELVERGLRDKVEIWANEQGSIQDNPVEFPEYVRDYGSENVDMWAFHSYYGSNQSMIDNNYSYWYHYWSYMRDSYGEDGIKIYITETDESVYGLYTDLDQQYGWRSWNDSATSQVIVTANVGLYGFLKWSYSGGYLPAPINLAPGAGTINQESYMNQFGQKPLEMWKSSGTAVVPVPMRDESVDTIMLSFHEHSLAGNYIPDGSDVLMVDWTGDDIRGSAFKTPEGEYTILLEANGYTEETNGTKYEVSNTTERTVTFNLKGLNKNLKFYKYYFNPDTQVLSQHATVNQHEDVITTNGGSFKDTIGAQYGVYYYTTMKPIKQVEIHSDNNSALYRVEIGEGGYDFDATTIDADGEEIVWSVAAASNKNNEDILETRAGTINKTTGKYTFASDVQVGDKFAIRASLKSDPTVYDVILLRVIENS